MIQVCLHTLPPGAESVLAELAVYQAALDACASYAARVEAAGAHWDKRRESAAIRFVREMLHAMCTGIRRCMYCEDSRAEDVEHVRPKALYPGLVFAWANFLYACAECNRKKGARFKVHLGDGRIVDVGRKRGVPVPLELAVDHPLLLGEPLLIDPRSEDPLDLLRLDLETGAFEAMHAEGLRHERARYTDRVARAQRPGRPRRSPAVRLPVGRERPLSLRAAQARGRRPGRHGEEEGDHPPSLAPHRLGGDEAPAQERACAPRALRRGARSAVLVETCPWGAADGPGAARARLVRVERSRYARRDDRRRDEAGQACDRG